MFDTVILIVSLVVILLVNWNVSLRCGWAWGLVVIVALSFTAPCHPDNPDYMCGVVQTLAVMSLIPVGCVMAVHMGLAKLFRHPTLAVPVLDVPLAFLTGLVMTGPVFRLMASANSPPTPIMIGHWVWALVAIWLVVTSFRGMTKAARLRDAVKCGFGGGLLILTLWSAMWFPQIVKERAEFWADGAEYAISVGHVHDWGEICTSANFNGIRKPTNLSFLGAPKGNHCPHFILIYTTEEGVCEMAWSYHRFDFQKYNNMVDASACPRP